jgi:hypothetical protein
VTGPNPNDKFQPIEEPFRSVRIPREELDRRIRSAAHYDEVHRYYRRHFGPWDTRR